MNCIVGYNDAGLFSNINKVMVCLGMYDKVHVDWSKGERRYYGHKETNLWNELFEPTEPCEGELIVHYPDSSITAGNAALLYGKWDWREKYHDLWLKVKVKPDIQVMADNFVSRHWRQRDVVTVMVRSEYHACEQVDARCQSLEEYAGEFEAVKNEDTLLHVMAGDDATIQWFKDRFPKVAYFPFTHRTPTRATEMLDEGSTIRDAIYCLAEVLIASRSRVLIHSVSNMATAALYINPSMEGIFVK